MNLNTKLTMDIIKNAKFYECDCGGKLFRTGMLFKRISALVSPTGKEELYPIEVMICEKCGKIPSELDNGILPKELLANKII